MNVNSRVTFQVYRTTTTRIDMAYVYIPKDVIVIKYKNTLNLHTNPTFTSEYSSTLSSGWFHDFQNIHFLFQTL